MGISDSDDKQVIDIKQELLCEKCNNPKISIKPEANDSTSNNTKYLRRQDVSDDKKEIDIKQELFCEKCNNPNISVKPEANDSTGNNTEYSRLQDVSNDKTNIKTDTIKQSEDQPQNSIDEVQIKREINSDSDIEVDLAYSIIDTFNACEVKIFKREDGTISPDSEKLSKVRQTNNNKIQLNEEDDNKTDFNYVITNNLNVCDKEKIAFIKENVDYDGINIEDDVNKKTDHQRQSKGM